MYSFNMYRTWLLKSLSLSFASFCILSIDSLSNRIVLTVVSFFSMLLRSFRLDKFIFFHIFLQHFGVCY